jgi:putative tryptophan/tyrosine transport system substrate-binding protein
MKRRQFITLLGGAAVAGPVAGQAQQLNRVRRIGVLMGYAEGDPNIKSHLTGFLEGLRALGWIDGKNVQVDYRTAPDIEGMRSRAAELLSLGPELIVTALTPVTRAAREVAPSVPIVFTSVSDPIGVGFVESFARPGGNVTGFTNSEPTMGGKWLSLLLDIAPSVSRVAMLFNPETANAGASGGIYLNSIEAAARLRGKELVVRAVHDPAGIDQAFAAMAQSPGGGFLVMPSGFTVVNRERITALAAQYQLPTIYSNVMFPKAGGLLSYGIDSVDLMRQAAGYADRILKGAKPADLPVQAPTNFSLVINLKTAKALGLTVPPSLLTIADEVIE